MKSLILRDFRAYRTYFILIMIIMVLYSYLNIRFGSVDGIIGFITIFLTAITGMVLFLGDNELIPYMASLPVSRRQLVLSKYLSTCIFTFVIILATIFITWLLGSIYIDAYSDFLQLASTRGLLFAFLPVTLLVSIAYPFLFKFGLNMGSRVMLAAIMISYAVTTVLGERFFHQFLTPGRRGIFILFMNIFRHFEDLFGKASFYTIAFVLMLVIFSLSVMLSIHFMNTKDIN